MMHALPPAWSAVYQRDADDPPHAPQTFCALAGLACLSAPHLPPPDIARVRTGSVELMWWGEEATLLELMSWGALSERERSIVRREPEALHMTRQKGVWLSSALYTPRVDLAAALDWSGVWREVWEFETIGAVPHWAGVLFAEALAELLHLPPPPRVWA